MQAAPHVLPLPVLCMRLLQCWCACLLQIIVLILSQDTSFSHNIHKVQLSGTVSWYRERVLTKISLGSLVYVVLLR